MKLPADCMNMEGIRTKIDRDDAALVAALAKSAQYIDRAAQIKTDIGLPARIPDRVEEVVANVGR